MHYLLYIAIPKEIEHDEIESYIEEVLAPYENTHWDWYRIGGRWNGVITGNPVDDGDGGGNYSSEFEQLESNMEYAENIKELPAAFLTLRKKFVEHKIGMSENGFIKIAKKFLEDYKGLRIVAIDCHI